MTRRAILALADGTTFEGEAFGSTGETVGEVVFNTSMSGYQEILTDPSYVGQIVTMAAPEMGNVGTNPIDDESRTAPRGGHGGPLRCPGPRATGGPKRSLDAYLKRHGVVGHARHRHPQAGPPPPYPRGADGGHLQRGPLGRGAGGAGPPRSGHGGARSGDRESRTRKPYVFTEPSAVRLRPGAAAAGAPVRGGRLRLRSQAGDAPAPGGRRVPGDGGPGGHPASRRFWRNAPTASSSPTALETRRRWPVPTARWRRSSARCRCSASASGTRSSPGPSEARPTR